MITNSLPLSAKTLAPENNQDLSRVPAEAGEGNKAWLARAWEQGYGPGSLLLLGGNSVAHFRVRVAQSHLRYCLTPSYWSLAGILKDEETFYSAPLDVGPDISQVPCNNALRECRVEDYNDPAAYPNVAVIKFTDTPEEVLRNAERLRLQRSLIDLPALVVAWLSYVWCVGNKGNPLHEGLGLPGAVLAETAFGMAGIELTPGLASASTCPEAIWQAAKWWRGFYEETSKVHAGVHATAIVPDGWFFLRQPAAAVREKEYTPRWNK